jgi:hypothetical protein
MTSGLSTKVWDDPYLRTLVRFQPMNYECMRVTVYLAQTPLVSRDCQP